MACLHLMRANFQLASSVFRIAQCKSLDAYIRSLISYFLSDFVSSSLRNSDLFRSPCSWIVRWYHHAYPLRIGVSRTMALVVLELETYLIIIQCMDGIALRLGLTGFWSTYIHILRDLRRKSGYGTANQLPCANMGLGPQAWSHIQKPDDPRHLSRFVRWFSRCPSQSFSHGVPFWSPYLETPSRQIHCIRTSTRQAMESKISGIRSSGMWRR